MKHPQFLKLCVLLKTVFFFSGLLISYTFMDNAVTSLLMNYLTFTSPGGVVNQRRAAIITNLQDGLSCISVAIVYAFSEAYTGRFIMITFCSSASIMGLMLLWISAASTSNYVMIYVAISLITLGRVGGSRVLEDFFYYQLHEKVRAETEKKPQHENADNERKEDHNTKKIENQVHIVAVFGGGVFGYATTVIFCAVPDSSYLDYFRFAALLMVGAHLFFYFGYSWYSHESLPPEINLGKIFRICKAAIIKGQETEGELCSVTEVKSLALLFCWSFTFFAYSLVAASGNTFFVEQASNLKSVYSSHDVPLLFVLKSFVRDIVLFFCWLIGVAFKRMEKFKITKKFKRINARFIRIGIGMVCSLFCCVKARNVELRRLHLIKMMGIVEHPEKDISMSTKALVPQFLLLGVAEGLTEDGLTDLFHGYVSQSMRTFDEPFSQLVIGIGKLLTIPCVLIFSSWFKETANLSHLDRYYLMLAVLNSVFLLLFAFCCFRYACKNEYLNAEEIETEEILEHARQADSEEVNATEENLAIREGLEVSEGSEEIVVSKD